MATYCWFHPYCFWVGFWHVGFRQVGSGMRDSGTQVSALDLANEAHILKLTWSGLRDRPAWNMLEHNSTL